MSGPTVVIGSGPNGLSAAIALARAGRQVTVLEAFDRPGGAVATEEVTLPGFRHDLYSAVYPAAAASPVFARMGLERHGLRWVHPTACYAHPLPGGEAAALYRDLDATIASLDAVHAGDGERWATFAGRWLKHVQALRNTLLSGFPPVKGPLEIGARMGPAALLDLAKLLLMPAHALALEVLRGQGNRAWLYGAAMHGDVPPDGAGSAIAATYLNVLGHSYGWPSPEGGSARLADALIAHLRELGGELQTGKEVTRIAVERGRVTGVETADGDRFRATLVIADTMPGALLRLAGDALGGRYAHQLGRYRPGPATLKIDWALDGPIPWEAPAAREAGTVHVGGPEDEVLETTQQHRGLPDRPFLLLGQQSLHDPTRAPAGQHTAWAYTHGPQSVDWATESERHVERVEAQVERFAPGFRDRILGRFVQSPADLEARNPNLVGGDVGGGSYTLDQMVFRPVPSLSPYRTPVRGLYLGSAAAFPGGAVHGVPGDAAARIALAEGRLRRF
ncbi:MAG TPA: NAD(P)/FAD-dependent oxidoreductase [Capillimicrobium sp.]